MAPLLEFLYLIRPSRLEMLIDGGTERENTLIGNHFAYLKQLTEVGVMVFVGRTLTTDEKTFGIAVFRAESEDAARLIMENDPAIQNGVFRAELYPFRVALRSRT